MPAFEDPVGSSGDDLPATADPGIKKPWATPVVILSEVSLRNSGKTFFPLEGANFSSTPGGAPISTPHGPS